MYTKQDIIGDLVNMGIHSTDTLLIHSSMKAIGEVDGGADTVIDAIMEYMKQGLLIFPTHTWEQINDEYRVFKVATEPSCVGLLTNLFMKRPGVLRSWHPTHSVAAIGEEAEEYISGEEYSDTPCPRSGCWGKLYDRGAKILFLGCSPKKNTYLHGVEEWNQIGNRLTDFYHPYQILTPNGRLIDRPMRGHHNPIGDISQNYDKMMAPYLHHGIAKEGMIGDAKSYLCDAVGMAELTSSYLQRDPDLFLTGDPIPDEWL
ncbi:MAG: aminoglycoside N(3)-acetyltransferase [Firmicutes bacterium]|nr:aminoglycoside N(3)-acetyltransferase [Bacillota bacterium]